jgi:hypothetical protein
MKKIVGISMACFLFWFFPALTPLQAQVYTWTDENGVRHYSNVAPSESAGETIEKIDELTGEDQPAPDSIERALQGSSEPPPEDTATQTNPAETEESETPALPEEQPADDELPVDETPDGQETGLEDVDLPEDAEADLPEDAETDLPEDAEADLPEEAEFGEDESEEAGDDAESEESQNSLSTQDVVIEQEKERTRQLVEALSDGTQGSQQLIENEKRRLEQTITELENQPLERFGSQQNKRRQIGFYQYRLQQLNSSPEVYLQYGDEE